MALSPVSSWRLLVFGPEYPVQESFRHGDAHPMSKLARRGALVPVLFPYSDSCTTIVISGTTAHGMEGEPSIKQEQSKDSSAARVPLPRCPRNQQPEVRPHE
jgi:hypothetical protein